MLPLGTLAAAVCLLVTSYKLWLEGSVRSAPLRTMVVDVELEPNGTTGAYHRLHDREPPFASATILLDHDERRAHPRGTLVVVQCHRATCYLPEGTFRPAYLPLDVTFLGLELGAITVGTILLLRRRRAHRRALGAHLPTARTLKPDRAP